MKRTAVAASLVASIALLLSACGGGGSDDQEGPVRDTVERIATAESPSEIEAVCADDLTTRFIDEVYGGDVKQCVENPLNDDSELENVGVNTADDVAIDGSTATVKIVTEGGIGGEGTWTMAEEDGSWKLDRYEDDFTRDTFLVAVNNTPEGMLTFEPMKKCITPKIAALDATELRRLTNQVAQDETGKALDVLNGLAEKCPRQLNLYVADTLTNEVLAEQGLPKKTLKCAERQMVPLIELTGLGPNALKGNNEFGGATSAALAGIISGALKNCGK